MDKKVKTKDSKPGPSLFAGFDIGSSFVHYVVLTEDEEIIYSPKPIMHFADPIGAIKQALRDINEKFGSENIKNTAKINIAILTREIFSIMAIVSSISPTTAWILMFLSCEKE